MIAKSYNVPLVVLSIVVATLGAYAAVEIAQRVRATEGRRRERWIYSGALAMGLGIWSMHFVGMLALRLPVPVWYDALLITASVIAAIVGCAIAFFIFSHARVSDSLLLLASVFMGAAIAGMHYTGMAGMRSSATMGYDPVIVAASVAIAIIASFVALAITRNLIYSRAGERPWLKRVGAALLLGFAVVGMHYTGMAAASFQRGSANWRPTAGLVLGTYQLGLIVAIVSVFVLLIALAATQFERWTIATRGRFENLLELAPQVIWFAQPDGRLVYCNPYWYDYTGLPERATLGEGWISAIHPDDRERVAGTWQAAIQTGDAAHRDTAVLVDEAPRDTETIMAPQIVAKGLRYSYKGGDKTASVLADPEKLQQIVLNLLTNAVKFTDAGGSITLSAKPRGNCIEISVADTGAGISPEKLERIFDPFVQAERRLNQPVQGVGLGLAISRDLAQAMDGEITVESTVGKGSTFTLSLPRAPRMDPADVPRPADMTDHAGSAREELSDRPFQEASHS